MLYVLLFIDKGIFDNETFTSMLVWETFELNQWPSLNYYVYLVGLHQIQNYYTIKGWYIKSNIKKKVSWIYVSSDLIEPENC